MATAKPAAKKGKNLLTSAPVRKKKPMVRRAHLADEKYTGPEPQWDTERAMTFDDDLFYHHMSKSLNYYNYHYSAKDLKPDFCRWLAEQKHFEISKSDIAKVAKTKYLGITACGLIRAHEAGMPLRQKQIDFIERVVRESIEAYDRHQGEDEDDAPEESKEKREPYKPTIQDRLNEKFGEIVGEMEGWYDEIIMGREHDPKTYEHLTAMNTPQAMVGRIRDVYQKYRDELEEAQSGSDPQLKEAYSNLKAKDFKRHFAWLDKVLEDCDRYAQVKKTTRKARIKKAPSKEKLVAKLKYCKDSPQLKMVSINPAEILNAQELWVYNVKTRKLGKYITDQYAGGLGIKGTTLVGFDEHKSVCKTLRKPDQQLGEFMKSSKVQLRKFLDNIKATETKLNGRINTDTMLLKAIS